MRPRVEVLAPEEVEAVLVQALEVLEAVGFAVHHDGARAVLADAGVRLEGERAHPTPAQVHAAIQTAPPRFALFDRAGAAALDLGGGRVQFDPGSSALSLLDPDTGRWRPATTPDCAALGWVTEACTHMAAQATALVPSDVPEELADRWRLYVALLSCTKPVVTGTFRADGFAPMYELLCAVRGGADALRERPLALFDCCPTPPLAWSEVPTQALLDCARAGVPANVISVPLGGATAPVTLREMLVQHTAENLSGVLLHQLAGPGAPLCWGGFASAFDMRHGTTRSGAVETTLVALGTAAVGARLGLPTHAYLALSDAKSADWQAGFETGQGAALAALAGVDLVSGPGMLGFVGCQSLEKLVLDDAACGAALRLARGIGHGSADAAPELLAGVVERGQMLGHPHTRKSFRGELFMPGPLFDTGTYGDWEAGGGADAFARARARVRSIIAAGAPAVSVELQRDLRAVLERATPAVALPWI